MYVDINGARLIEAFYENNRPCKTARLWHFNGQLAREVIYGESPEEYSLREWDTQGILKTL